MTDNRAAPSDDECDSIWNSVRTEDHVCYHDAFALIRAGYAAARASAQEPVATGAFGSSGVWMGRHAAPPAAPVEPPRELTGDEQAMLTAALAAMDKGQG